MINIRKTLTPINTHFTPRKKINKREMYTVCITKKVQ